MPGYTHLQRAQPVTFAHWCLAYVEMLARDESRLQDTLKRLDVSPLGSGALAGTAYEIDREQLAGWLGFASATRNSTDSVSDRDHVLELLSNASIGMVHLSRFAEDLIFFNSGEAGFVELSDRVTSGSSLMPQKKNPDALELIRGKCGRVQGALTGMMMTLKGLPLAYNKDMQEDKEGLFDALDTARLSAYGRAGAGRHSGEASALSGSGAAGLCERDRAGGLPVAKGVPFREAHHIVGEAVVEAIRQGKPLEDLALADLQKFSAAIGDDVYPILALQSCRISVRRKAACRLSRWRWPLRRRKPPDLMPETSGGGFALPDLQNPSPTLSWAFTKKRTTGSAKVHVGFSCSSFERNSLTVAGTSRVKHVPPRLCGVLFNRMLDRDNRSLLCYLSP